MILVILHEDGTYDEKVVIEAGQEVYTDGDKAYRVKTSRVRDWTDYRHGALATPQDLAVQYDATVDALGVWYDTCAWAVVDPNADQEQAVEAMYHDMRRLAAGAYSSARDSEITKASRAARLSDVYMAALAGVVVVMPGMIVLGRFIGWL
ncbi:MAG: hypothetical protein F4X54_07560 [Chloroflexi bacterium]|nr:hypothetical protein [Chloroflexota bacterium]MYB84574.1 hypothetical protein [Chloroflexota bacterium]